MPVPKRNLNLPDPAAEAYSVLNNFDTIVEANPRMLQEEVPDWLKPHWFRVEDTVLKLGASKEVAGAEKTVINNFDGSTQKALWLPSGILQYGNGSFAVPGFRDQSQFYLIGRRVSRGDPREGLVFPAIFSIKSRMPLVDQDDHQPVGEDITSKANRLTELNGWLKTIIETADTYAEPQAATKN